MLTAGLVGLGLATMAVVSNGVEDLSGDVDTQLSEGQIITTSFGQMNNLGLYQDYMNYQNDYSPSFNARQAFDNRLSEVEAMSDAELLLEVSDRAFEQRARELQIAMTLYTGSDEQYLALDEWIGAGMSAADMRDYVQGELGPDQTVEQYFAKEAAWAGFDAAVYELAAVEADKRNLDY